MKMPSFADAANLEIRKDPEPDPIPDDISLMELADRVVRGKLKLGAQQMRLLIELLPYHAPKLMAVATMSEGSFGRLLDDAIERSNRSMKLIEAKPEPISEPVNGDPLQHDPSEMKGPMAKLERY
jgi:hypothetical protein